MEDRSHKLIFLAATGAMWAVVAYGAQLDAQWFGPIVEPVRASVLASPPTPVLFPPSVEGPSEKEAKGSVSILPNNASCPAPGALVLPPSTDKVIGKEDPSVPASGPAQAPNNANLGTGSACPSPRADTEKARTPGSAPAPHQGAQAKLTR